MSKKHFYYVAFVETLKPRYKETDPEELNYERIINTFVDHVKNEKKIEFRTEITNNESKSITVPAYKRVGEKQSFLKFYLKDEENYKEFINLDGTIVRKFFKDKSILPIDDEKYDFNYPIKVYPVYCKNEKGKYVQISKGFYSLFADSTFNCVRVKCKEPAKPSNIREKLTKIGLKIYRTTYFTQTKKGSGSSSRDNLTYTKHCFIQLFNYDEFKKEESEFQNKLKDFEIIIHEYNINASTISISGVPSDNSPEDLVEKIEKLKIFEDEDIEYLKKYGIVELISGSNGSSKFTVICKNSDMVKKFQDEKIRKMFDEKPLLEIRQLEKKKNNSPKFDLFQYRDLAFCSNQELEKLDGYKRVDIELDQKDIKHPIEKAYYFKYNEPTTIKNLEALKDFFFDNLGYYLTNERLEELEKIHGDNIEEITKDLSKTVNGFYKSIDATIVFSKVVLGTFKRNDISDSIQYVEAYDVGGKSRKKMLEKYIIENEPNIKSEKVKELISSVNENSIQYLFDRGTINKEEYDKFIKGRLTN